MRVSGIPSCQALLVTVHVLFEKNILRVVSSVVKLNSFSSMLRTPGASCLKLADTRHRTMTTRREQRDANTNLLNIKSLKSWNICCKQQPEVLDRQHVQERELMQTCA